MSASSSSASPQSPPPPAGEMPDELLSAVPVRSTQSPLEPYLTRFITYLQSLPSGFSLATDSEAAASACDVLPAFVETIFVSARARGLVENQRGRNARNRSRWQVSRAGRRWLAEHTP